MTGKVQKIKDWISKKQDGLMDAQGNFEYPEHEGAYHILCNLDAYIDSLQEEAAPKILEDMLNAKTAAESLGISAEEHDKIIDLCLYGKEPEMVDIDDLPKEEPVKRTSTDIESAMQEVEEKSRAFTEAHQGENADTILAQMRGEEPVSEDFEKIVEEIAEPTILNAYGTKELAIRLRNTICGTSISNNLEEAASLYVADDALKPWQIMVKESFKGGARWKSSNLWKDAQGDDLPEIDKEVIVLVGIKNPVTTDSVWGCEVAFAHRPNPNGWDGKSITTGKVEHYDVQTYGKGGWNIPDVVFWLDCELPKMEE